MAMASEFWGDDFAASQIDERSNHGFHSFWEFYFALGKLTSLSKIRLVLEIKQPNNTIHHYEICPNFYFDSSQLPSELNVPYQYPPLLMGAIAAPIRLAAQTDLALGAYGTAIWLDSHTEIYYQASLGQRVAGTFAKLERRPQSWDENANQEDTNPILSDNSETRDASFVFTHQHHETWTGLTLDEEEGVIFLGRNNGVIDVFKYIA